MNATCKLTMAAAVSCLVALDAVAQPPPAARSYAAAALIAPCRTADSDSREEGAAALIECEQYILGFVDGLETAGAIGPGKSACPPAVNTGAEVRWAFMRWVYGDFTARRKMSAAQALMQTLKESFPCK